MVNRAEPPRRVQISLRTFLIAVLAAGLTLGILGQLFRTRPEIFVGVVYVLSTIVPFVLAIGTIIWVGYHRSPIWSLPVCAGCRRDLRWLDLNTVAACPRCGADLASPGTLAFVRSGYRSGRMIAWGVALVLMPGVGITGLLLFSIFAGPSPGGLGMLSNKELIEQRLSPQVDEPWVWRELEQRVAAGKLTAQEADAAVKALVLHMKTTKPNGWDGPFHWQEGFLKAASSAGLISEPVLLDLCDAFYGTQAQIQPLPRVREDQANLHCGIRYGSHWNDRAAVGVQLLWDVTSVRLGDKSLLLRQTNRSDCDWSGYCDTPLPAGNFTLTIEIECAYIDTNKLVGLNTRELTVENWPEARKRWTQSVSTNCKVYTKDEPILKLVTDFPRSPEQTGGIQINRFVVQDDREGKKLIGLNVVFNENLTVPIAFDVTAKLAGEEVRLGSMHFAMAAGWSTSGGGELHARIDSLDPAIRHADLILTPNPSNLEPYPQVEEIWGETIVIPRVLLDRFDLGSGAETSTN